MGKERFEQWIYDHAFVEIKHYHGDNGIFSSEEYCDDCTDKMQSQSFSGVGAQSSTSDFQGCAGHTDYYAYGTHIHGAFKFTLDRHGS